MIRTVRIRTQTVLPLHGPFLCRINLSSLRYLAEEKSFDVVEQERLRVGIGEVQTVVIDDLCLLLQPTSPARLADLAADSLSERVREWGIAERRPLLATVCAFDCVSHLNTP